MNKYISLFALICVSSALFAQNRIPIKERVGVQSDKTVYHYGKGDGTYRA